MFENESSYSRRRIVTGAGLAAGTALILGQSAWAAESDKNTAPAGRDTMRKGTMPKGTMTPMEDLTSQHALVGRILLVYQMSATKDTGMTPAPTKVLATAAGMIRSAVDEFHVRIEEDYLFPLFEKSGNMTSLVSTLRQQHAAGKRLNDTILQMASASTGSASVEALAPHLMAYSRMIQAHTAYEETLLYPQIRSALSDTDYERLQTTMQEMSNKKLGPEGFAGMLAKVEELERSAGITGLAQFTPKTEATIQPTSNR